MKLAMGAMLMFVGILVVVFFAAQLMGGNTFYTYLHP